MKKQHFIIGIITLLIVSLLCFIFFYKQVPPGQKQADKESSKQNDSITKSIHIDSSNFKINKASDDYDSIDIEGFEQSEGLKLPYRRFEIWNLPLDMKINEIKVNYNGQINLGKLNIPIYQQPMCDIDCYPATFEPNLEKIGLSSDQQFAYSNEYRVVSSSDSNAIFVYIHPVIYNGETLEATLFKSVDIDLDYTSFAKGLVTKRKSNKKQFNTAGEEIIEFISIKNLSSDSTSFRTEVEIQNLAGDAIASEIHNDTLGPEEEKEIEIRLTIPDVSGSYRLFINVYNGENIVHTEFDTFNIIPKQNVEIVSFNTPEKMSKATDNDYTTFEIFVKNSTQETFRAYIKFYIYEGTHKIATRPQMFMDLGPNETKEVKDHWNITDLELGKYSVQAVVSVGDFSVSEMKSFEVIE